MAILDHDASRLASRLGIDQLRPSRNVHLLTTGVQLDRVEAERNKGLDVSIVPFGASIPVVGADAVVAVKPDQEATIVPLTDQPGHVREAPGVDLWAAFCIVVPTVITILPEVVQASVAVAQVEERRSVALARNHRIKDAQDLALVYSVLVCVP